MADPNKAIRFEQADIARTYLILNEHGDIAAYFSLSTKQIEIDDPKISKGERKKLDGLNKNADTIKAYLIGQIGKNAAITNNPITIIQLLTEIYLIVNEARKLIGGRTVVLECEPNVHLLKLYETNRFRQIRTKNSPKNPLVTLYIVIKD